MCITLAASAIKHKHTNRSEFSIYRGHNWQSHFLCRQSPNLLKSLEGNNIISMVWTFSHLLEHNIKMYTVMMFAFSLEIEGHKWRKKNQSTVCNKYFNYALFVWLQVVCLALCCSGVSPVPGQQSGVASAAWLKCKLTSLCEECCDLSDKYCVLLLILYLTGLLDLLMDWWTWLKIMNERIRNITLHMCTD